MLTGFWKAASLSVGENVFELPKNLPSYIKLDASYLEKHKESTTFKQYTAIQDYFAVDSRHMSMKAGETVSGFS